MYVPSSRTPYVGNTTQTLVHSAGFRWFMFFFIHFPLFVAMYGARPIATAHAAVTFVVAMYVVLLGDKEKLYRVAYAAAYITGAEVLWRMAKAQVPWEFGKYATAAIFIVALLRMGGAKPPPLAILYFVLLVPSAVLTLTAQLPDEAIDTGVDARELISFNLSGPFALFVCAWYFSNLKLTRNQLQKLFLVLISPVVGIGIYTLIGTLTAKEIKFTGESNFTTSGGFGPNQVSNMLGLGAMLAFIYMQGKVSPTMRITMLVGMLFMAMQSAMTFSRGGLYNAAIGAILAVLFLFRDARQRAKIIFSILAFFVLVQNVAIPMLDEFTGGAITDRFQNTNMTGRDELAMGDYELWANNPVFGVGPGMAKWDRQVEFMAAAAHTEFTRLVAEHGTLGFIAFIMLLAMAALSVKRSTDLWHKALVAAMLGWTFVFMMNAAMRLVAPAFILGLTMAQLLPDEEEAREPSPSRSKGMGRGDEMRMKGLSNAGSPRSLRV